ncbi:HD domain-containing protein [Haloplanus sp. GCM10025708]|uniref:HD domain-containing protein n=1 Tax=Haloferacaceae TaxID=1644056 RepID=UPI003610041D
MTETTVREAFPAIAEITDDELRSGVLRAWAESLDETGHDLFEVPWFPPVQTELDLPDERLVPHVNDVVASAVAIAERLRDARGSDVSIDLVRAGALVHDVSKLYEFDTDGETAVHDALGHPHYGVVPAARAELPAEVLNVVLSHSNRTSVEPSTLEAVIVKRADQVAAAAIRAEARDDPREV